MVEHPEPLFLPNTAYTLSFAMRNDSLLPRLLTLNPKPFPWVRRVENPLGRLSAEPPQFEGRRGLPASGFQGDPHPSVGMSWDLGPGYRLGFWMLETMQKLSFLGLSGVNWVLKGQPKSPVSPFLGVIPAAHQ